ncbi:hypothetical protein L211DRAFT_900645 [Terfezia boudieri ATCC MYA-4762]|uniref:Uncharacterized protein n=1 Tax=Terfezia boudieri ATCC MYA-4762 TaxID=1051890 RepID=A0A3N4L776_9PEZI|nr:hypothetical protein L211DRAFT_900645 [Terfezia boudieri ATCC MYA-4762]
MPRVSQRKVLIEWFLWGIERHQAHLDQERFQDFLQRTMRQLQQELGDPMDIDDGSSVTVTLSETEDSDSISSLLSSEWDSEDDAFIARFRRTSQGFACQGGLMPHLT